MSRRPIHFSLLSSVFAVSFLLLALAGCESKDAPPPSPGGTESAGAPAQPSPAALAVLAKADAFDGKSDKVVSKCLTCSLGMEGSAEHVVKVGDYQLHLCSGECKAAFEKAPEKALLAVKVPEVTIPEVKIPE